MANEFLQVVDIQTISSTQEDSLLILPVKILPKVTTSLIFFTVVLPIFNLDLTIKLHCIYSFVSNLLLNIISLRFMHVFSS